MAEVKELAGLEMFKPFSQS
jgi:CRP-like cAMP-binding protein